MGQKRPPNDLDPILHRQRVGAFVRQRRGELSLSQGDLIRALGYVSRNSVSHVETGREGLPSRRIHDWADALAVPREAFFRFVTGETTVMTARVSPTETELVAIFRGLRTVDKRRLIEHARALATKPPRG